MKKSLIALAALGACGIAAAQSSVTLFGIVDTAFQRGIGSVASRTQLGGNGITASRLGFRGVEDLGGGYSAGFWLEAQLFTDNGSGAPSNTNNQATGSSGGGAITFNRRSTVSLSSPLGEIRVGRDFLPQYYNIAQADPLNNTGAGSAVTFTNAITGVTLVRASNAIHYYTPQGLPFGLYAHGTYYFGENASNVANRDDGTGHGLRVGFINGPLAAAVAVGKTHYAAGDVHQNNALFTWDLKVAKLFAGLSRDRNAALRGKGWVLGATAPFGPHLLKAAVSSYETSAAGNPEARKLALGYQYDMSKRTAIYTNIARVSNSGGATTALSGAATGANQSSSGLDIGIRHNF